MSAKVDFCGLEITRLVIGGNPFGGYSHQTPERDKAMRQFHTVEQIIETWRQAVEAGITAMVTNNETPHVLEALEQYFADGTEGKLQWIAQVNHNRNPDMMSAIDEAVKTGCKALFIHGGVVDKLYQQEDGDTLQKWVRHAQSHGVPVGTAGHAPVVHDWVNDLDIVDFHAVCFFDCGSVHNRAGERFRLEDITAAVQCIQRLEKPCIAYKIMGAGRIDAKMAFQYAFENIKAGDVVNVGMHRGDKETIIQENADLVDDVLSQLSRQSA
ncbi:MAG: hypothetical protein GKR89_06195 [Candidatus Latescibacteria bacterium]|nr:hypothetical protein [Candidatus Latescibacterota bacterium]